MAQDYKLSLQISTKVMMTELARQEEGRWLELLQRDDPSWFW